MSTNAADRLATPLQDIDASWVRFVLVACGVAYLGLSYEAWGWPAIDGYPTIERFLDPGYLITDFYTNTSRGYGVDTLQAWLFGGLQRLTGVPYDAQLAALNLLRCLVFPALVYQFFLALSNRRRLALTGAVLGTLANFALPKTLGWAWVWGDTSTAMIAVSAVLLGWTCLLRRRVWACSLWFAIAAAMHPLTVVHGGIVAALIFWFDFTAAERRAARRGAGNLAALGAFAAVFLAQYIALRPNPGEQLPIGEYLNILAYERHPGDFLPSRFSGESAGAFGLIAAAVLVILARFREAIPRRRLVLTVLASYALICVGGYLFVEIWPVRAFVQLMPYRTANLGAPFMLFVIAAFGAMQLECDRYFVFGALALAAMMASPYAARVDVPHAPALKILAAGLVLALALGAGIPRRPEDARLDHAAPTLLLGRRLGITLAGVVLAVGILGGYRRRAAFALPRATNQHPLYTWAREHTEPTATFLVDQFSNSGAYTRAVNPQKMRLVGRRAVVASLDFPFLDRDMRPWYERWKMALAGRTPDRVDAADVATLEEIRARFPFEYVVRRSRLAEDAQVSLVATFGPRDGCDSVRVYRLGGR